MVPTIHATPAVMLVIPSVQSSKTRNFNQSAEFTNFEVAFQRHSAIPSLTLCRVWVERKYLQLGVLDFGVQVGLP